MSQADVEAIKRHDRDHVLHPWRAQKSTEPLLISEARGCYFWDSTGTRYLDFSSQLVFCNLGHSDERVSAAIAEQAKRLPAVTSSFATEPKAKAARLIAEVTPGDLNRTFFSTTGAEANEAAIKLCRMVTGKNKIITRYRSYHGSTFGAMSISMDPRSWPSEPGIPQVVPALDHYCYRCPFGKNYPSCDLQCSKHIEEIIKLNGGEDEVAGIILEPIVGANGVIVPPDGYLQEIREICDRYGMLMIADEVMVGFGRTGRWFACDHWGVVPDIMTLAKGLTNGAVPLAATVVREEVARFFDDRAWIHGHTYSGHALSCAAAAKTIEIYREDNLIERSRDLGDYLMNKACELQQKHSSIGDVRGKGLFVGIELVRNRQSKEPLIDYPCKLPVKKGPQTEVLQQAMREGLYLMSAHPNVLMLCPPLIIKKDEIDWAMEVLDAALVAADEAVH